MLKIIFVAVVVVVTAMLGYAATRPDTFRVERRATIQAPPETIFAHINDFRRWGAWSPYEKLDPDMKRIYGSVPAGAGAVYEWQSDSKAGQGRMEMTATTPPSKIVIQLDFLKPIEAHNVAEFTLEPRGGTTTVTWAMEGRSPFFFKVMGLFVDVDHLVGRDFETGLANLKSLAEA
jgi:uncharacterized protein YndB with AHSA1/START domain